MNNIRCNAVATLFFSLLMVANVFALPQALLSYYFDETTGTVVSDSGAFGNHNGTLKQSSPTTPPFSFDISTIEGKYGSAINFTGAGSCYTGFILADMNDANMLPGEFAGGLGISFTVSFWFKTLTPSSQMCLLSYAKNGIKLVISTDPTTVGIYAYASDFTGVTANSQIGPVITADAWHHVAAVVNNGVVTLYYDGTTLGVTAGSTGLNQTLDFGVLVGARYNSGAYGKFYVGQLDDIVIYNDVLSAADAANLYAAKISSPLPAAGTIGVSYSKAHLSWNPANTASLTSRTVQVATDADMTNIVQTITIDNDSAIVTDLNENTTYYWRVNTTGIDSDESFTQQGNVWWFITAPSCRNVQAVDGDFNTDCLVDFSDFAILAGNWMIQ